jgi:hypothetical protein
MTEYKSKILDKIAVSVSDKIIEVKASINRVLGNKKEFVEIFKNEKLEVMEKEQIDYSFKDIIVKDGYYICDVGSVMADKLFNIIDKPKG